MQIVFDGFYALCLILLFNPPVQIDSKRAHSNCHSKQRSALSQHFLPHLLPSQSRLIVTFPTDLFPLDRCDVDLAPFGPQNFSAVHGTLRYFRAASDGNCEGGSFTKNEIDYPSDRRYGQIGNDVRFFWRPLWDSARGLIIPPLRSSLQIHDELSGNFDRLGRAQKLTELSSADFNDVILTRKMGQSNNEIWIFEKCNTTIENIITQANTMATAILFFDRDFSPSDLSSSVCNIPVGSINSQISPLSYDLSVALNHLEIMNNLSIRVVLDDEPNISCISLQPVMIASLCFIPLWWGVAIGWLWFIYIRSNSRPSPLDQMLLTVPGLKSMICLCTFLCWIICPNFRNLIFQYLLMAYMGLTTVFFTSFFTVLLLAAKGFTVTRTELSRQELIVTLTLITLVYVTTSINQVNMSLPSMLVLYLCLLLTMWKSVTRNLNFINSRLQYIEWQQRLRNGMHQISETSNLSSSSNSTPDSHLDEFFAALSSKVATFERIRQLITFYFVGEIIIVRLILIFWLNVADIATITQLSIELITVSWLCVALHERSRLSAATQLLQQSNGATPPILSLFVSVDQSADSVVLKPTTSLFCQRRTSRPSFVIVVHPNGNRELGVELQRQVESNISSVICGSLRHWRHLIHRIIQRRRRRTNQSEESGIAIELGSPTLRPLINPIDV